MKSLIKYTLAALFYIILLSSCKDDSAFGGGLWFIPLASGLAAVWSFGKYFYEKWYELKVSKTPLAYGIILALFTIGAIIYMINEK